uniref:Uncharacterized protein LOC111108910 n=1 Tax=Crassostrea virginica TaxID=6565 RepID=A0A8B8BBA1_CRAVI|nr:uncharacterized protein LOC111108910 [Crassostrea virginica]
MWYVLVLFTIIHQISAIATGSEISMEYRFKVFPVNECPGNKTEFERASEKMNCSGRYLCAPNRDLTNLIEFCTDRRRSLYSAGNCVRLQGTGDLNHYNCSMFSTGCPNEPYSDDEIYKFPACLNINGVLQCYVSEKTCLER